jgi:hypothetical protein
MNSSKRICPSVREFLAVVRDNGCPLLFFLINKVTLLAAVGKSTDLDFYDFWDNRTVVTLWSLQRLAVVHSAFSISYILRIFSDATNFV